MSFSPQSKNNYSAYGFSAEDDNDPESSALVAQPSAQQQNDYSKYGFDTEENGKPKEKVGWAKSILYGLAEGAIGLGALAQYGVNEISKPIEQAFYGDEAPQLSFEQENPLLSTLSEFPESEDETARRVRTGVAGGVAGIPFGIPGIIAGVVGSQAGQTIREIYGNEGKFDTFGWGEGGAIAADLVAGGGAGALASLARQGPRVAGQQAAQQARNVPAIFQNAENAVQRSVIKNTIQGEKRALDGIINNFGAQQIQGFEQEASRLSPNRYTELVNSSASAIKRQADDMFRNTQLSLISPLATTPEQGGRAIQDAANAIFQSQVINAERGAYSAAREAATGIAGSAPRTVEEAKALLANLTKSTPTPEQQPVINFLSGLISDLETTTPASTRPASSLLDASGVPISAAQEIPASATATRRSANDLVDLVQRANQAVNYESELRLQSHRLTPIIRTLRNEVGTVLDQNPSAASLYQEANELHARNAQTWGTKYMRNLRFAENPEQIISKTKLASNMRNLKEGIEDPTIQGLAERLVIQDITKSGSSDSNRAAVAALAPELRVEARNAAQELVNVKDPLTTPGGRAAIRNEILKDAAKSVNTGKRPTQILDLMQTPKGYNLVRESLNATPQSRELFQSFERLFVEDIFSSITNSTGEIDFNKARNIFKNRDVREVTERIGGPNIIRRFNQLEGFANNFDRNMNLYKSPETKSLFQRLASNTKSAGVIGAVLHALHMPWPIIAGLGITKGVLSGGKITYDALSKQLLQNPRAVRILESISIASTTEELAKQVPRLIAEIEKTNESD